MMCIAVSAASLNPMDHLLAMASSQVELYTSDGSEQNHF
jgi:hypothetical protein